MALSVDAVVGKGSGDGGGSSPESMGSTRVPVWCQFLGFCLVVQRLHLGSAGHLTTHRALASWLWPAGAAVFQGDVLALSLQIHIQE